MQLNIIEINRPTKDGCSKFLSAIKELKYDLVLEQIQVRCDINARDDNGNHALHLLLSGLNKPEDKPLKLQILNLLLKNRPDLDVQPTNALRNKPYDLFQVNNADDDVSDVFNSLWPQGIAESYERPWTSKLYDSLILKDINELDRLIASRKISANDLEKQLNRWIGSCTLLYYAVDKLEICFLKKLLDNAGNSNTPDKYPLLYRALARSSYEKTSMLLTNMNLNFNQRESLSYDLFSELILNDTKFYSNKKDVMKCLNLLIEKEFNVNATKNFGESNSCSVIHLAAELDNQEILKVLIMSGAYIGSNRIVRGTNLGTIINKIHTDTLEEVMDSCVLTDTDNSLDLKYNFLVPSTFTDRSVTNELIVLKELSESPQKEVIEHPLIQAFLYAKWKTSRIYFWSDVVLYFLFMATITYFMCTLSEIPITESSKEIINQTDTRRNGQISESSHFLIIVIGLFFCYIVLREVLFFIIFVKKKNNFTKWFMTVSRWIVFLTMFIFSIINYNSNMLVLHHLSAWILIISWYRFLYVLGRLKFFSLHVIMMKKVITNFVKVAFFYSTLILAFGASFYIIMKPMTADQKTINSFATLWSSMAKTVFMATGEFDYSDNADGFPTVIQYRISCVFMFIAFMFLIFLVIMNIMNGLAVCDAKDVMRRRNLRCLISKVDSLYTLDEICSFPFLRCFRSRNQILTGAGQNPQMKVYIGEDKTPRGMYKLKTCMKQKLREISIRNRRKKYNADDPVEQFMNLQTQINSLMQDIRKTYFHEPNECPPSTSKSAASMV